MVIKKKTDCPLNIVTGFRGRLGEILKETHLTSVVIHVYTRHMQTFTPSLLHLHVNLLDQIYEGRTRARALRRIRTVCFALASSVFSHIQVQISCNGDTNLRHFDAFLFMLLVPAAPRAGHRWGREHLSYPIKTNPALQMTGSNL